jgi:choline dehydrogenase-like flavoprotein
MAGTIVEGRNVADNVTLIPDFCIIGSGAGGGVCALKLTEAGFDVLVLEEGPNIPKEKGPAPAQERKMLNERSCSKRLASSKQSMTTGTTSDRSSEISFSSPYSSPRLLTVH